MITEQPLRWRWLEKRAAFTKQLAVAAFGVVPFAFSREYSRSDV